MYLKWGYIKIVGRILPVREGDCVSRVELSSRLTRVTSRSGLKPELLAPAGDRRCLIAAVENGADAIYFGLQRHNARARATNFDGAELNEVMDLLHKRGVKGYVALNTLAFPRELADLESTIREVAEAGVDAVIVQDLGICSLIRAITPDLEIHASTQMSVTSEEGVRLAKRLGCSRVILARELSLDEIEKVRQASELPVEVFVHGALCVAYSGQCLTSEALGSRSANRGECAQACRMPYEIVCDGELKDLGNIQYLLSPQDLAAYDLIPRLIDLGVASLKIEGRLKTPEYVANITQHYRRAIDAAWDQRDSEITPHDVREMELSFSRGFSHGFFDGTNHKVLVRGDYAKKRGIFLGTVAAVTAQGLRIDLTAPLKCGDGLVIDAVESSSLPEQGGRVYELIRNGREPISSSEEISKGLTEIRFGRHDVDLRKVRPGQSVWKTDDPELTRRLRKTFEGAPHRTIALDFNVTAETGKPLVIDARTATGLHRRVESDVVLVQAERLAATQELFQDQLGRLGGSIYHLGTITAKIVGGPLVPKSLLNGLRRRLVESLERIADSSPPRTLTPGPMLPRLKASIEAKIAAEIRSEDLPSLSVLCRTTTQIEVAVAQGIQTIYAEYQDIKEYRHAVEAARQGNAEIFLATPRIEKPFEGNLFKFLAKQGGRRHSRPQRGGDRVLQREPHPLRGRLFHERGERADGGTFEVAGCPPRHCFLRPECRPA